MQTNPPIKWSSRFRSERGSLPLALLAVIIFAGLMTAVIATTLTGQRSARYDRDFMAAISGADAGVQEVLYKVNSGALSIDELQNNEDCGDSTINGIDYTWCAEVTDDDGKIVEVRTMADLNGVSRTVVAELQEIPAVPFVAFTHTHADLPGSNVVDSFDSTVEGCVNGNEPACDETWSLGGGIIATNETVSIGGSSSGVEGIYLYNWKNDPDWERCRQTGQGGGTSLCTNPEPEPKDPFLTYTDDVLFIEAMFEDEDELCPGGEYFEEWRASVHGNPAGYGPGIQPLKNNEDAEMGPPDGLFYCTEHLVFDRDTQLVNGNRDKLKTDDETIIVYVKESITVRQQRTVGCTDCDPYKKPPLPTHLRLYSIAGEVDIRNQAEIATILFAPNAKCGVTSNAQVVFYGAMICEEIDNQGGWEMYYDKALFNDGTGRYRIESWREEPGMLVEDTTGS